MKEFTEDFAALSQRMSGADADRILALAMYQNLAAKRDLLLIRNVDDLEIGVYDVPGGHIAITELFGVLEVAFHADS